MKIFSKIALVLTTIVVFNSCYKETSISYDEMDVTLTMYDKEFSEQPDTNFQTYKTFIIRDSVGLISDYIARGSSDWINFYKADGASQTIRQAFRRKFLDQGYIQTDILDSADFAVNLVATLVENTGYVGYPGYWYGWGGYYPGWGYYYKTVPYKNEPVSTDKSINYYYGGWYGGYYPWYGGGYSYSYETTSIMTEMIDAKSLVDYYEFIDGKSEDELADLDPEDFPTIYYRWQSFIHGVLSSDGGYDSERFDRGVNEAFTQSPYIYSSNN